MTPPLAETLPIAVESDGALLAAVQRFAEGALAARDPEGVLRALAAELLGALGADRVHLLEVSQDAQVSRGRVCAPGADGAIVEEQYVQSLTDRSSGVQAVVASGEPLHAPDAARDPRLRQDHVERFGAAGCLFLPVRVGGEVQAVPVLVSERPREFTGREVTAGRVLCDVAGAALARLQAEARRPAELRHQTAVARAARALTASLELEEVLSAVCGEAEHALAADMAGVYLGDGERGGMAVAGHGCDPGWLGRRILPGEGLGGQVLQTGRSVISNDYQNATQVPDIEGLHEIRTAVSVPMRWDGELRGALSVAFNRMRRITVEDLAVLEAIADLASVACQNAEAYEGARVAAQTDSLTGLLNHGAMQGRVAEEVDRARRSGRSLALLLVDLDHFKALNDSFGHQAGDAFLRRVTTAFSQVSRPYDGLARYGGDEFVLALPDSGPDEAIAVARRLQGAVREAAREAGVTDTGLAASVGVAEWCEPLSAIQLLERADRALLLAKRTGRARIRVAGPEVDAELATLDGQATTSPLVREFWAEVARSPAPDDGLALLPAFLRRRLELEEVALYVPSAGTAPGALRRLARARVFGDPAPSAFRQTALTLPTGRGRTNWAVWRHSLAEVLAAVGIEAGAGAPTGAYAAVPLGHGRNLGGLLLLRGLGPSFPADRLRDAEVVARQATIALGGQWGDGSLGAVQALAAAIDARDNYTHEHSEQVVALASAVARALGLPHREVQEVERAALLHDVGKVAIPNDILHKPGRLSAEEWTIMREHPVIGERILHRTPELAEIAPLVRHEHERWDGHGYPDGIAGTAIPMGARIILACDAYNAMITRRPYREPMPREAAETELRAHAGSQFDPAVVQALLRVLAGAGIGVGLT